MKSLPEIERIVLHSRAVENRRKKKGGRGRVCNAKQKTAIDVKKKKKTGREQEGNLRV